MTATTAPVKAIKQPTENASTLSHIFKKATDFIMAGTKKIGSLAFEFVKTNPIVTFVAGDLAATGGEYTQEALVGITKTVAGAIGDVTVAASNSLWDMVNPFD